MDIESNDAFSLNEAELMEYYNLKGKVWKYIIYENGKKVVNKKCNLCEKNLKHKINGTSIRKMLLINKKGDELYIAFFRKSFRIFVK